MKTATLHFFRGNLKFSAAHFTIFSAKKREFLHGHNYNIEAELSAALGEPGITFDYYIFRNKLAQLCRQLHSRLLLPTQSPYLAISEQDDYYQAIFNLEKMLFLQQDVVLLPLSNITVEELSHWFIQQLTLDSELIDTYKIQEMKIKVFNGDEHCAEAKWLHSSLRTQSD